MNMNGANGSPLLTLQEAALQQSESLRIGEVELIEVTSGLHAYAQQLGLPDNDDTGHVIREGLQGRRAIRVGQSEKDQKSAWRGSTITADALRTKQFPPLVYVLPGYITEGVTILASKPKVGKSWLALDLCAAVAGDRFTLGTLKPAHGDVLYLALEDSPRRLRSRLHRLLPSDVAWSERLRFATEWKRLNEGGLADIKAWAESVSAPRLVVIDTLEKARPSQPARAGGPTYSGDYDALTGLQRLAHAHNLAIVVVHHQRKMDADDPFDTISGTLGLTGAADSILILRRQQGAVTLHARGRDIEEREAAIQFDKATCKWSILGEAAEVFRSDERNRILLALKDHGKAAGLSVSEVVMLAELPSRNAADQLLFKMAKNGEVMRLRRGIYAHPDLTGVNGGKMNKKERELEKQSTPQYDASQSVYLTNLTASECDKDEADEMGAVA